VRITMIGHSTVLIDIGGRRVLTDPYFGTWGNPAYARLARPARTREELTAVDCVLISHGHWDHVDSMFLRALGVDVPVVTSVWARWQIRLQGARDVRGLRTWQETQVGDLAITATPAPHVALGVGFVIRAGGRTVYFAGDTYHGAFTRKLGEHFAIDVALIPVTTYRIPMTMGEDGAVLAVRDLKPSVVVPIHEGLEPRSPLLRTDQTVGGFKRKLMESGVQAEVVVLRDGQSWPA